MNFAGETDKTCRGEKGPVLQCSAVQCFSWATVMSSPGLAAADVEKLAFSAEAP